MYSHKLVFKEGTTEVIENGFWQGTIVYMEISTSRDIDPNEVVDCRTFRNLNSTAERSILVALQRRYRNICQ